MKKLIILIAIIATIITGTIIYYQNRTITLHLAMMTGSNWDVPEYDSFTQIDEAITRFEDKYPNVKITYETGITPELYDEYVSRKIIKHEPLDMMFIPSSILNDLINCNALEPLNKYIVNYHLDTNKYYSSSLESGMIDNVIYSLPYESVPRVMFVNKTLLEKYGVTNILNSGIVKAKIKNTVLQKYGVENVYQNKDIRKKCVENTRKTLNEKYGVNWISNIPGVSKKIFEHGYETKLKNGTLNTSIIEDKIKDYLIEHNIEFKQQYKSKEYPYSCDFYFPAKDLYVEIQAHWTHGGHPYNENNVEDINVIEKWKAKNTKYFNNAINTWTVRDVNKRNIATQNNLNYVEIFSNNFDECIDIIIEKLK